MNIYKVNDQTVIARNITDAINEVEDVTSIDSPCIRKIEVIERDVEIAEET